MDCPDCGTPNDDAAERCEACRVLLDDLAYEEATADYSGLIPTRNKPALWAYYLGLFSFVPGIGLLLGIAAVVLGSQGLARFARHPEVKGKVHAWIGIWLGGFFTLFYVALTIFLIVVLAGS